MQFFFYQINVSSRYFFTAKNSFITQKNQMYSEKLRVKMLQIRKIVIIFCNYPKTLVLVCACGGGGGGVDLSFPN